jgi:hypothetical protein
MAVTDFKAQIAEIVSRNRWQPTSVKAVANRLQLPDDPQQRTIGHYRALLEELLAVESSGRWNPRPVATGLISVGSIVHKRHRDGWTGIVQKIDSEYASVLWSIEKYPDRLRIDNLRPSEHADKWSKYFHTTVSPTLKEATL